MVDRILFYHVNSPLVGCTLEFARAVAGSRPNNHRSRPTIFGARGGPHAKDHRRRRHRGRHGRRPWHRQRPADAQRPQLRGRGRQRGLGPVGSGRWSAASPPVPPGRLPHHSRHSSAPTARGPAPGKRSTARYHARVQTPGGPSPTRPAPKPWRARARPASHLPSNEAHRRVTNPPQVYDLLSFVGLGTRPGGTRGAPRGGVDPARHRGDALTRARAGGPPRALGCDGPGRPLDTPLPGQPTVS